MTTSVPSLSSAGWVNGIAEKADRLIAYFFYADKSQSTFYPDTVHSLPYLIQQYGHDSDRLESATETSLQTYLTPYFDQIDVKVTVTPISGDEEGSGRTDLRTDVTVYQGENSYSLGRLIQLLNGEVIGIIDRNN